MVQPTNLQKEARNPQTLNEMALNNKSCVIPCIRNFSLVGVGLGLRGCVI